jgi:Amt family ammonium transporter
MTPHNLPMTMIGASMLWFGWFGFNAGSALEANNFVVLAFVNTFLATAVRGAGLDRGRVDVQGQAVDAGRRVGRRRGARGDHAGGGQRRHPGALRDRRDRRRRLPVGRERPEEDAGADDALDVFGVHGVGGILGAILTGVFNSPSWAARALPTGSPARWPETTRSHRRSDPGQGRAA